MKRIATTIDGIGKTDRCPFCFSKIRHEPKYVTWNGLREICTSTWHTKKPAT